MQNLQVFVKPRTLDNGRWSLRIKKKKKNKQTNKTKQKTNKKKHDFLAAAILPFIGKIIIT